jgi:UDP-N-acetylglucosamine 2-epimerase
MARIEPVLLDYKPQIFLVVGDVNSTIAAALTAVKLGIDVAHIEAGLRSFDMRMPEEKPETYRRNLYFAFRHRRSCSNTFSTMPVRSTAQC